MKEDGTCPKCGRPVAAQQPSARQPITAKNLNLHRLAAGEGDEADMKAPWHFKLLMVMLGAYLVYRVVYLFV
ncbi:MAG: hypothetical protein K8R99_04960 [Actinomycetia bacterium]|nr:hypothetical protein [Actinomycetes bacterium]